MLIIVEPECYASHNLLISLLVSLLKELSYTHSQGGMPKTFISMLFVIVKN